MTISDNTRENLIKIQDVLTAYLADLAKKLAHHDIMPEEFGSLALAALASGHAGAAACGERLSGLMPDAHCGEIGRIVARSESKFMARWVRDLEDLQGENESIPPKVKFPLKTSRGA